MKMEDSVENVIDLSLCSNEEVYQLPPHENKVEHNVFEFCAVEQKPVFINGEHMFFEINSEVHNTKQKTECIKIEVDSRPMPVPSTSSYVLDTVPTLSKEVHSTKSNKGLATFQEQSTIVIDSSDEDDADLTDNKAVDKDEVFYCDDRDVQKSDGVIIVKSNNPTSDNHLYKCHLCKKSYKKAMGLRTHMRVFHSNVKLETCSCCAMPFSTVHALTRHMSTCHPAVKLKICSICGSSLKTAYKLALHMSAFHSDIDLKICPYCTRSFKTIYLLTDHMLTFHSKMIMPHSCQICTRSFKTMPALTRHIATHGKTWNYLPDMKLICQICSQSFETKCKLTQHLSMHKIHK